MPLDANGIWMYSETDTIPAEFSDLLNQGMLSVSAEIADAESARTTLGNRITAIEDGPQGLIEYTEITTNQSPSAVSTYLKVTVTVAAVRSIRVSGSLEVYSSVAGDNVALQLWEGATLLQSSDITLVQANTQQRVDIAKTLPFIAGTHVYSLAIVRKTGSGTLTCLANTSTTAFIQADDLGRRNL